MSPSISTPDRRLRVFVSSTLQELAEERGAVRRAITAQRLTPVMFELGARPHAPRDLYRAYLDQSDVFVGIYARSYGWVAPGEEVSGLEDEYLLAGDRPRLIYVKTVADREPRLQALLDRVKRDDRASYQRFSTAEELARLLAACPDLTVLVTSRTVLGLRGEHTVPLAPLATPLAGAAPDPADVDRYAAVQLFVDRVRQVRPGFALTAANATAVAELCRLLDGIPLALELAAAQLRILTPAALLGRLRDRLSRSLDLDGDLLDTPARQRTLRATLEWSHSLLGSAERSLLARLSVFSHTWTLAAAEAVGVVDDDLDAMDTLSSLVGQSLVTLDDTDPDELRFSMLATVRGYARERLVESGEQATTTVRLTAWLRSFAEVAGAGLTGPDNRRWAALVDAQLEDLRAALQHAADGDDAETVIRLAAPLFTYWWNRGLLVPMKAAAEQAAALPSAGRLPPDASALLLWARGMFRISSGRFDEAEPLLDTLLARTGPAAPPRLRAFALAGLGLSRVGAPVEQRRALLAESVTTLRELGDPWGLAFSLSVGGQLALQAGDPAAATAMHEEALAVARAGHQDHLQAQLLDLLGLDAMSQGRLVGARRSFVDGADLHRRLADAEGSANCLDGFAAVALAQARPEVAARLLGASAHARELAGVTVWPGLQPLAAMLDHGVRTALGAEADRQGRAWGATVSVTQALAYAVQATEASPVTAEAVPTS